MEENDNLHDLKLFPGMELHKYKELAENFVEKCNNDPVQAVQQLMANFFSKQEKSVQPLPI